MRVFPYERGLARSSKEEECVPKNLHMCLDFILAHHADDDTR